MDSGLGASAPLTYEVIQAEIHAQNTVNLFVITLDREEATQNVLDKALAVELARAVRCAQLLCQSGKIDLLVLCSGKKGRFLAGADIKLQISYAGEQGAQNAYNDCWRMNCLLCSLETLPLPTIALINGPAIGGGLEITLSCDYRVAIGHKLPKLSCPEVKLGVLPGIGGVTRLPRLIGFQHSLSFLLTGVEVGSRQALKLGLVDAIWPDSDDSPYSWINHLVGCIEERRLGWKQLAVNFRQGLAVVSLPSVNRMTEELLIEQIHPSWQASEKKVQVKFPHGPSSNPFYGAVAYIYHLVLYVVTAFQLWCRVGRAFSSPYYLLRTIWQCYHAPDWLQATTLNAVGFVQLVMKAECKGLMGLFLSSRRLKKQVLECGNEAKDREREVAGKDLSIVVVLSKKRLTYGAAFIQSLLYAKLNVLVVLAEEELTKCRTVEAEIKQIFGYAVRRGYISEQEVEKRMKGIISYIPMRVQEERLQDRCVLINMAPGRSSGRRERMRELVVRLQDCMESENLVLLDANPLPVLSDFLPVCLYDTLRKNTTCVEISLPVQHQKQVSHVWVRLAGAITDAIGKTPVMTVHSETSQDCNALGWFLVLQHWTLAVDLNVKHGIHPQWVEQCLKKMGFTISPYKAMKSLDEDVFDHLEEIGHSYDKDYATLHQFVRGNITAKHRAGRSFKPDARDVCVLFKANLAHACALLLAKHPQTKPEALDFLCVFGTVGFPLAEGGPISFTQLIGTKELVNQLCKLTGHPSLGESAKALMGNSTASLLTSLAQVTHPVLSSDNLEAIGPTTAIQNLTSFLNPLPISLSTLFLLGLMLVAFLLAGVSCWLTGGTGFAIGALVLLAIMVSLIKRLS